MMVRPIESFCTWYLARKYRVKPIVESENDTWERERAEFISNGLELGLMHASCGPYNLGEMEALRRLGPKAVLRNSLGVPIETVKVEPVYIPPQTTEVTDDDCF